MYAERETHAVRTPVTGRNQHAERNRYTERKPSHRWPMVVREAAVESAKWRADAEPLTDPEDEIFLLGERCARAYMQADALHYRAMKLLAEFDRRSGWQDTGFSSTAEWLAWRIGIKPGGARERLRTALALEQLPETSEAMKSGELSYTKVRAITRVARPDNETALLAFARAGSAAALERVVRGWKALDRRSEVTAEQLRHRSRRFSAWVDDDGMVVVKGRLDPEVGALFMRAVDAASDALYREEADLNDTKPEERRADAVGLIAERALGAGFGGGGGEDGDHTEEDSAPISGTRADRYQVMLHVDMGTLQEDAEAGRSELEDGTRVSAETSRRIACDAGLVKIFYGADGQVVGAGRRSRTTSPSMRRALEARDRGCRFPGCGLRFTDAHHVKHWADGGETSLQNMILLCKVHHRAVHEGGGRVCIDRNQQVVLFTPRGRALFEVPPERDWSMAPESPEPGGSLRPDIRPPIELRPSHLEGASRWKRDEDIPWEVEARAWEALDSG
jgi:hypothetical protein